MKRKTVCKNIVTILLLTFLMFGQSVPVPADEGVLVVPATPIYIPKTPLNSGNSTSAGNVNIGSAADQLGNYYFNQYKNSADWFWLKTTNVNYSLFSGNAPSFSIQTFQPFALKSSLDDTFFLQAQYGTSNNTINAGLGYRKMNNEHDSMYGFNLFYDNQLSVQGENGYIPSGGLTRIGAGLEYFRGPLEFRANGYYGISNDVQVGSLQLSGNEVGTTAWLHVSPGADLSVSTDFSFFNAPWAKIAAIGSYYKQKQGGTINGYLGDAITATLSASLQLTPQLQVTAGVTGGNGASSNESVGFQFNLLAPPTPAMLFADSKINIMAETDISYKMLQPVLRNNTITTERYTKTPVAFGTASIKVLNAEGQAMRGVVVSINGGSVTAITDTSGIAFFPYVPAGQTNFYATINGALFSVSAPVVSKQLTIATIQAAFGNAIVTVKDGTGVAVPYAVVSVNGNMSTCDSSGVAGFSNLPSGTTTFTTADFDTVYSADALVVAKQTVSVEIVKAYSSVNVTILGSNGVPLSGVKVYCDSPYNSPLQPTTDSNGVAVFTSIPVGNVLFYFFNSNGSKFSETVTVTANQTALLTIKENYGNVNVVVLNAAGNTLSNIPVYTSGFTTVNTNNTGVASFTSMGTGVYEFQANIYGYSLQFTATVRVIPNQTVTATIQEAYGGINVTVKDSFGVPLPGIVVTGFYPATDSQTTNANGVAMFTNKPATKTNADLTATIGSYIYSISPTILPNQIISTTIQPVVGSANVTVTRADGTLFPGIEVGTDYSRWGGRSTSVTNSSGVASFINIPIDQNAENGSAGFASFDAHVGNSSYRVTQRMLSNQTVDTLIIAQTGTITGTISGLANGNNVVATVGGHGWYPVSPVWSGSNYKITNVPLGTQVLTLSCAGYISSPIQQNVNVNFNSTSKADNVNFVATQYNYIIVNILLNKQPVVGCTVTGFSQGPNPSVSDSGGNLVLRYYPQYQNTTASYNIVIPSYGTVNSSAMLVQGNVDHCWVNN